MNRLREFFKHVKRVKVEPLSPCGYCKEECKAVVRFGSWGDTFNICDRCLRFTFNNNLRKGVK